MLDEMANEPGPEPQRNDLKEIKLNPPKPFTGKQTELKKFTQDVTVYLSMNSHLYDTDQKKIAFVLSFMNDGDAASWKEEYLERRIEEADERGDDLNFGTFQNFKKAITASFSPYDAPGDALDEMRRLRMTSDTSMDEHVAKFKILVTRSGLSGNTAVQDFFRETLFPSLQRHILCCDNPPATLDDWYKKASQYHANYKKMQRIFGQKNEASASNTKTNNPGRKFTFP